MIEATVGRGRGGVDAVARRHRSDKDIGAPDLQVDARLAVLHGAQNLGAQRFLFSLARATPSEGAKTAAEPHIAEQSMPVSNGFGSRNFGIIVHSITVGSIPLARSAARASSTV